jgi:hypothetical protein
VAVLYKGEGTMEVATPISTPTSTSGSTEGSDWHFFQCFGERTPGEKIDEGSSQPSPIPTFAPSRHGSLIHWPNPSSAPNKHCQLDGKCRDSFQRSLSKSD